jgi:S-adenosyl-L-methionine hydrolase (adenosine-forming)
MRAGARPPIAILTDFGYRDHYAGAINAVIASIAPAARVIDITHGIPPQSVIAGALALRACWRFFPKGTIFLAVVDPGVGTARLPIAIETRAGAHFVGPDNGLLWPAAEQAGFSRAVVLRAPRYRLARVSATFHGRDIFAPAAAWLHRGAGLGGFGPALKQITRLEIAGARRQGRKLRGSVIYIDHYGNLITNIDRETLGRETLGRETLGRESLGRQSTSFLDTELSVTIGNRAPIRIVEAYGEARKGAPLATFGSFDLLEIAVRDGSAAEKFGVRHGVAVQVSVKGAKS